MAMIGTLMNMKRQRSMRKGSGGKWKKENRGTMCFWMLYGDQSMLGGNIEKENALVNIVLLIIALLGCRNLLCCPKLSLVPLHIIRLIIDPQTKFSLKDDF